MAPDVKMEASRSSNKATASRPSKNLDTSHAANDMKASRSSTTTGFRYLSLPCEIRQKILFHCYDPDMNIDLLKALRNACRSYSYLHGSRNPWYLWFQAYEEMWTCSRTLENVHPVIKNEMDFVSKFCENIMQESWIKALGALKLECQEAEELVKSSTLKNEEKEYRDQVLERQYWLCVSGKDGSRMGYNMIRKLRSKYSISSHEGLQSELNKKTHELSILTDKTREVYDSFFDLL